ncbi:MAG: hypothetical protein HZB51_06255 [Chloroflexi bacterium]|nr:hypothetical protein [Chloroflexota bacterium]
MERQRLMILALLILCFGFGCQFANMFAATAEDEPISEEEAFEIEPVAPAEPTELFETPTLAAKVPTVVSILPVKTPTRQVATPAKTPTKNTSSTRVAVGPTLPVLKTPVRTVVATTIPFAPVAGSSFVPPPPPCRSPNAKITFPTSDRSVSGTIEILGTANRSDLKLWKVEYRPASTSAFTELNKSDKGISNGVLGRLATKNLPNGTYWLRLSVLGKEHIFLAPCQARFKITN